MTSTETPLLPLCEGGCGTRIDGNLEIPGSGRDAIAGWELQQHTTQRCRIIRTLREALEQVIPEDLRSRAPVSVLAAAETVNAGIGGQRPCGCIAYGSTGAVPLADLTRMSPVKLQLFARLAAEVVSGVFQDEIIRTETAHIIGRCPQ